MGEQVCASDARGSVATWHASTLAASSVGQSFMGIGDRQLQQRAAGGERALRRNSVPQGLETFGGTDIHAKDLAPTVVVDADCDDDGDRDDEGLAWPHIARVACEPDVGPIACQRPVEEGLQPCHRSRRTAGIRWLFGHPPWIEDSLRGRRCPSAASEDAVSHGRRQRRLPVTLAVAVAVGEAIGRTSWPAWAAPPLIGSRPPTPSGAATAEAEVISRRKSVSAVFSSEVTRGSSFSLGASLGP